MDSNVGRDEFLKKLASQTLNRKLKWKENAEEGSFSATLGSKYSLRIGWAVDGIDLKVTNVNNVDLFVFKEPANSPPGKVWEIYQAAKESALGLQEAMEEMLSELDTL